MERNGAKLRNDDCCFLFIFVFGIYNNVPISKALYHIVLEAITINLNTPINELHIHISSWP